MGEMFKVPFTGKPPWCGLFIVSMMCTLIPGVLLWAITLGGFRYFHLIELWLDYTVKRDIYG